MRPYTLKEISTQTISVAVAEVGIGIGIQRMWFFTAIKTPPPLWFLSSRKMEKLLSWRNESGISGFSHVSVRHNILHVWEVTMKESSGILLTILLQLVYRREMVSMCECLESSHFLGFLRMFAMGISLKSRITNSIPSTRLAVNSWRSSRSFFLCANV